MTNESASKQQTGTHKKLPTWLVRCFTLFAITIPLWIYGSIPFIAVSSLGQMLWVSGFARSFANAGPFSIYAHDFGAPLPAPMAFGLSGTMLDSIILRLLPLNAVDAYALTMVMILALAFAGAMSLARRLGAQGLLPASAACLWTSLPMVWVHSQYSMLSMGFALLPAYFLMGWRLVEAIFERTRTDWVRQAAVYLAVVIVACFMDGYTFVMFAVATGCCWIVHAYEAGRQQWRAAATAMACILACNLLAVGLYTSYIGKSAFDRSALEVFRAFGASVPMLLKPTQGALWLWDRLGWTSPRTEDNQWGDASVFLTTFIAPMLVAALLGACFGRGRRERAIVIMLALFGVWMGLGPSIKLGAMRASYDDAFTMDPTMAWHATHNAWLSLHVPGFDTMRSAYRWIGLAELGLWCLAVMAMIRFQARHAAAGVVAFAILIFLTCVPPMGHRWETSTQQRSAFLAMRDDFFTPLATAVKGARTVAVMPRNNDFLITYGSAFGNYTTLNVGGDKNIEMALPGWKKEFASVILGSSDREITQGIRGVLSGGQADVVVLPYVDMLWDAHYWPPPPGSIQSRKDHYAATVACFADDPAYTVISAAAFTTIRFREAPHTASDATPKHATTCPLSERIDWPARDVDRFGNTVGAKAADGLSLLADGHDGYLLSGPYLSLRPGTYTLSIEAEVPADDPGMEVDVAAQRARNILAHALIEPAHTARSGPVAQVRVQIGVDDNEIETRVHVFNGSRVRLTRVRLLPTTEN